MKKLLLLGVLLTASLCFSQQKISESKKVEDLIRIWGLLKYKHPTVSRGKFDIDQVFIKELGKLKTIQQQDTFNKHLLQWIRSFSDSSHRLKPASPTPAKLFSKNEAYDWIENSGFSVALTNLLHTIKNNKNYGKHYASIRKLSHSVQFENDKELTGFTESNQSHRLLFLASFWNKMSYWNVNIYLTETPWNKVLTGLIPAFINKDTLSYKLAKDKLFAKLNDSHANYTSSYLYKQPSQKFSLYAGRIVNDSLVVKTIFNKSLAKKEGIEIGDVIYQINGNSIREQYLKKFKNRISASNENYLKSIVARYYLLSDSSDSLDIGLLKKTGKHIKQHIQLHKFTRNNYQPISMPSSLKGVAWKKLKKDIGYLNLSTINKSELKKAFQAFKNTKGLIIDLRNYPRNLKFTDLPYFLYPRKKVFMKILVPYAPSIGKYDAQTALKLLMNPFSAGRKNNKYYKGKIVLLVDRTTASMAEYFAMAIQAAPNCITIGEQTFGAVMNRNQVILKDKSTIDFTGNGAFYPDNTPVQRRGLKIDFQVKESAIGYDSYQYIDRAIKIIQKN